MQEAGPTALSLSSDSRTTAGIILITVLAVEYGGLFMLRIVRGRKPMTEFQQTFARAGHAHAGVLVTLALVCQIFVDAADLTGVVEAVARSGVPIAAILMPTGFFLSSAHRGAERPNPLIVLLYAGAASLALGAVFLGVGLMTA